jgi:hypothetical protein
MAEYTNTGDCPLILPSNQLKPIAVGDSVTLQGDDEGSLAVQAWIKSGALTEAKSGKKSDKK